MADIKVFVCCHQDTIVPKHNLIFPLQVGTALVQNQFEQFFHDNKGENISGKNRSYCELTGQYWAWKNVNADYYGFFHYRRYLYPNTREHRPYCLRSEPTLPVLARLGFDRMAQLIPQYDIIAPMGENMVASVREHYANAPHHHRKDLDLIETILRERHPEMSAAAEEYFSGSICYFGNIYIMSRPVFFDYCAWLFPLLEEFDRRADLSGYSTQALRVNGYLAERLFGVYYIYYKKTKKTLELPRVHFSASRPVLQRLLWSFFPPATYRRYLLKKFVCALKKIEKRKGLDGCELAT